MPGNSGRGRNSWKGLGRHTKIWFIVPDQVSLSAPRDPGPGGAVQGTTRAIQTNMIIPSRIKLIQLRRMAVAGFALWLCLAGPGGVARAQIQDRPKVGPELQKLEVFVGDWEYHGVVRDTPLGPGGTFSGVATNRWILDGQFLESRVQDKGVYGGKEIVYKGITIRRYDATTKKYITQTFDNDGMATTELWTQEEGVWKTTGKMTDSKGKTYQTRSSASIAANGKSMKFKAELLTEDGKTWIPYWEDANTKLK